MGATRSQPNWFDDQLSVIAVWSVVISMAGLLPLRTPTSVSDGMRLQILIRGGPGCDRLNARSLIVAAATGGTRPRVWPAGLIEWRSRRWHGVGGGPGERCATAGFWMGAALMRLSSNSCGYFSNPYPKRLGCRGAAGGLVRAFFRDDAITARKWFDAGQTMAAAALAVVEKRSTDATRSIPEALKDCGGLVDQGAAEAIRDELKLLETRVESGRETAGAM